MKRPSLKSFWDRARYNIHCYFRLTAVFDWRTNMSGQFFRQLIPSHDLPIRDNLSVKKKKKTRAPVCADIAQYRLVDFPTIVADPRWWLTISMHRRARSNTRHPVAGMSCLLTNFHNVEAKKRGTAGTRGRTIAFRIPFHIRLDVRFEVAYA
jgi:hypothetical protein